MAAGLMERHGLVAKPDGLGLDELLPERPPPAWLL